MVEVYLALGTNIGERAENLRRALAALPPAFIVEAVSPVYETEPMYVTAQPKFLNMACRARTALLPLEALRALKLVETDLGREPAIRFGPRLIDIDLLFYGDIVFDSPELTLPHPRLHERAFALVPLADIAPDLVHPVLSQTVSALRDQLSAQSISSVVKVAMPSRSLTLGSTTFEWGKQTYLMGIINVTPDSFSGDGLIHGDEWTAAAVNQAAGQVAAGAHILDVGGESTRPGSQPLPLEEELRRVIPAVKAIAAAMTAPISIDTYKAEVARQAIEAGAVIVNDVWGLRMDSAMAQVVADSGVAVVLMHNRSQPKDEAQSAQLGGRYVGVEYEELLSDIKRELRESAELALAAGVKPERIIIDPGIGFGKTVEQNLELVDRLGELKDLGCPILVGPSRKSFVGYTLNLPPDQRMEGTAAAVALCIDRGADIARVHDVAAMTRVARIADAIVRRKK